MFFSGHLTKYEISKHIVVQVEEVELMALWFLINAYIFCYHVATHDKCAYLKQQFMTFHFRSYDII